MVKHQLFIGAALVVGAAIGFFARPVGNDSAPAEPSDTKPAAAKPIADNGRAATEASLRARIADLEARLARAEAAADEKPEAEKVAESAPRPPMGPRGDFRAYMEEIKKNDPARYAQMTNRFAQMRRHQLARQQSKLDFLSSLDVSGMGSEAQKTHNDLQDAIVKLEELRERMHQEDISDEDRRSVFEEIREAEHDLRRLGALERNNLLVEMAKSMGLEGDAANDAARMVTEIITATESSGFGRPPHGGRMPRGGK